MFVFLCVQCVLLFGVLFVVFWFVFVVFFFLPECCASSERKVKFGFHVDVLEDELAEVVSQALGLLWSIAVEMYYLSLVKFLRLS